MFGTAFIPAMLVLFPAMVVLVSSAAAQNRDSPFRIEPQVIITPAPQPSPYQGFETREVKTLSTEKQEGLKRGSGLSYALAAEMNGYAGPLHVLELSEQLSLDADQKKRLIYFDLPKYYAADIVTLPFTSDNRSRLPSNSLSLPLRP